VPDEVGAPEPSETAAEARQVSSRFPAGAERLPAAIARATCASNR